jgi:hypothetical protein
MLLLPPKRTVKHIIKCIIKNKVKQAFIGGNLVRFALARFVAIWQVLLSVKGKARFAYGSLRSGLSPAYRAATGAVAFFPRGLCASLPGAPALAFQPAALLLPVCGLCVPPAMRVRGSG